MKTSEFNQNYELDTKTKGVRAKQKNLPTPLPKIMTADNLPFDPAATYYFFDESGEAVRQSTGMRRDQDHLASFGLKIVEIAKLRVNRDDALADGQIHFKAKIEMLQKRINEFELEKSPDSRSPESHSAANQ